MKRYFSSTNDFIRLNPEQQADIFERSRGLPGLIMREKNQLQEFFTDEVTMTKQNLKRWTHPITLGAVAGFMLGGAYLLFNSTTEEEVVAPVNAAQIEGWETQTKANYHVDNSDENGTMEEEPLPIVKASEPALTAAPQEQPAQVAIDPKPIKEVESQQKSLSKEEEHLLSVDKSYYTLQLVGARKEQNVKQFIEKHALQEAQYYHTKLSGKDWYVVVVGEYPSIEEAKAAAREFPPTVAAQPWIRDFASIHSDIKKL
jgi:hypothetical protein